MLPQFVGILPTITNQLARKSVRAHSRERITIVGNRFATLSAKTRHSPTIVLRFEQHQTLDPRQQPNRRRLAIFAVNVDPSPQFAVSVPIRSQSAARSAVSPSPAVRSCSLYSALPEPDPRTTIVVGHNGSSWRFKATCGHVKQTAKALARRLCAGFFCLEK